MGGGERLEGQPQVGCGVTTSETDWQQQAACRGAEPSLFNARRGSEPLSVSQTRQEYAIRTYCRGCPVLAECLAFANKRRYGGVWGGRVLDPDEAGSGLAAPPLDTDRTVVAEPAARHPHGTYQAVRRHRARGEDLCALCEPYAVDRRRRDVPPCGTPAAYARHRRRHETIDDACRKARRDYLVRNNRLGKADRHGAR